MPMDTLLSHDSAAEVAEALQEEAPQRLAGSALGCNGVDDVDRLVAEAVRQAKASHGDDELAPPQDPAVALVSDTLQLVHGGEDAEGGEGGVAGEASGRWLAYGLCGLVTWNLFCNHWSRDCVGALKLPLEEPPFALSVRQYNSLSAAYFAPNVPVPILAGMLAQSYGPAAVYVGFAAVTFAGNVLMSAACAAPCYPLLLAGRALTGFAYEALDLVPIGMLAPRFASSWAMVGCSGPNPGPTPQPSPRP